MKQEVMIIKITSIKHIADKFKFRFRPCFQYSSTNQTILIFVLEKYYFRIKSNLASMVRIEKLNHKHLRVTIIIAGVKYGLLEITLSSERSMLKDLIKFSQSF